MTPDTLTPIFLDTILSAWRFSRTFQRLVTQIEVNQQARYLSQYRYFLAELENHLQQAGYTLVDLEGQIYDPGMAATALNLDEFEPTAILYVTQMLEPVLLGTEQGVIRAGRMLLGRMTT